MDLLCESLVGALADPDSQGKGSSVLRSSIQKSFSSMRYSERNKEEGIKRPSRKAETNTKATTLSGNKPSTSSASERESLVAELQGGVRDAKRLQWLINHTFKDRVNEFIESENKLDTIRLYPHLRDRKVLIYEYLLVTKNISSTIGDNCKKLLNLLSSHLNIPQHSVDGSLEILKTIQEQLLPKQLEKQNLRKAITFKDATQVDERTLAQLNTCQAPCIVSTVTTTREGKRVLSTSVLLMHDEVINVYKEPTVFQVMQQLLAPYWLFDMKYPRAYESFLRVLEKFLHGELSAQTKKTRPKQEYVTLMRSIENLSD